MENTKSVREPLVRLTKRVSINEKVAWIIRIAAFLLGLVVVAIFMKLVIGMGPVETFSTMIKGSFGNKIYLSTTMYNATKLLCISVALAPAFKMRFWNIGAEGQLLAGALAAAICMMYLGAKLPNWALIALMFFSAVIAGAVTGVIPAIFKAKFDTNETLFTLMMNYIAIQLVKYFTDKWKGDRASLGTINRINHAGWLPDIFMDAKWLLSFVIVLIITVLMFLYLKKTKRGYEIAVVGESVNTAKYAGINVSKVIIRTMILSGAICGIAGFLTVSGKDHSVDSLTTGGGYGFTGIIVAWLSKFNTLQMVVTATLIVALERGTQLIASNNSEFDASSSKIVIGIILFFVIASEFFINYKINIRRKEG